MTILMAGHPSRHEPGWLRSSYAVGEHRRRGIALIATLALHIGIATLLIINLGEGENIPTKHIEGHALSIFDVAGTGTADSPASVIPSSKVALPTEMLTETMSEKLTVQPEVIQKAPGFNPASSPGREVAREISTAGISGLPI